jgi:large subunit ribosomal protein L16
MKQYPSSLKYKKNHKPSSSLLNLSEHKNYHALKGQFLLRSVENARLYYNQVEACRKSIRRTLKKQGIVYIRVFTNFSITKKSLGSRMGSGKGPHYKWMSCIRKGQVICEVISDKYKRVYKALKGASSKLPFKSKISRNLY